MRRSERLILSFILLVGVVFRMWGLDFSPHPDARFDPVPLLISAGAGAATVWLVFQLAAWLFDRLTALTAAFFLATAYLDVRESHFATAEIVLTMLAVGGLIVVLWALREPTHLIRWIASGALGAVALTVFLLASLQPLRETPVVMLGRGWMYHLTFSLWYGVGAPLLFASLAGLAVIALTSWQIALVVGGFPLIYYVVVGGSHTVLVRYMTPLVPFVSVTAAFFVVWMVRRLTNASVTARVVTLLAIVLALPSIARVLAFDILIGRTDTRAETADWIATHVKSDETVGQLPPALIYPDAGANRPSNVVTFDVNRKAFLSASGETVVPDWMIVPTSPLRAYTVSAEELETIASTGYRRDVSIVATHGVEMPEWFDQQDLFFLPYTTFTMRDRPGPEIQIFRRLPR